MKKKNRRKEVNKKRGFIGQRTSIDERPTIPCKKVILTAKDKSLTRAARRKEERDAYSEIY